MFSHLGIFHLTANCCVLYSMRHDIEGFLPDVSLAVYLAGGCFSGLMSLFYKVAVGSMIPSLGASGAVIALMAYHIALAPSRQMGILLIPPEWVSFSGTMGLLAFGAVSVAGMIWTRLPVLRGLDHAGHLAGVCLGYLWGQTRPLVMRYQEKTSLQALFTESEFRAYLEGSRKNLAARALPGPDQSSGANKAD
jgi:membrane associated rhomboid family serine protease